MYWTIKNLVNWTQSFWVIKLYYVVFHRKFDKQKRVSNIEKYADCEQPFTGKKRERIALKGWVLYVWSRHRDDKIHNKKRMLDMAAAAEYGMVGGRY